MFFSPANMVFSCTTGMVGVLFSSRQLFFYWINVCVMIGHLCNVLFSFPEYFLCYKIILGMTLSKRGWLAMRDRCCVCSKMRLVQKTMISKKSWKEKYQKQFWPSFLANLTNCTGYQGSHSVFLVTLSSVMTWVLQMKRDDVFHKK